MLPRRRETLVSLRAASLRTQRATFPSGVMVILQRRFFMTHLFCNTNLEFRMSTFPSAEENVRVRQCWLCATVAREGREDAMQTTGTAMGEAERPNADAATLIRRWVDEVWNKGMAETVDELFPHHALMWGVGRPEAASQGPAEFREFYEGLRNACPDVKITLDQVVQERSEEHTSE